jgi:hypothetical protein
MKSSMINQTQTENENTQDAKIPYDILKTNYLHMKYP